MQMPATTITEKPAASAASAAVPSENTIAIRTPQTLGQTGLIPGDRLVKLIDSYPVEERELILWFYHHLRDSALDYEEGGALLKQRNGEPYSRDSVYQLLTGRRDEATRQPILRAIAAFKEIHEAALAAKRAPFIETTLASRIFAYIAACIAHHRMGLIEGDSQIGKSAALEEFRRQNNHGRTIYIYLPTGGSFTDFLQRLCLACGISTCLAAHRAKAKVLEYFTANMCLLVDEAHQVFMPRERPSSYMVVEFCREIFEQTKATVILCATKVFRQVTERTGTDRKWALQTARRSLKPLVLESTPKREDLDKFAAHFGLAPATGQALELQREITKYEGLGVWITYLAAGAKRAAKRKHPMSWEDVLKAHAAILSLSTPPTEDER